MEVAVIIMLVVVCIALGLMIYRHRTARQKKSPHSTSSSSSSTANVSTANVSTTSASTASAFIPSVLKKNSQSVQKSSNAPHSSMPPSSVNTAKSSMSMKKIAGVPANDEARSLVNSVRASARTNAIKKYMAVGVRPQLNCCRAVMALENLRFLAEEAPHFPVPGCQFNSCRCQYIYFSDRRDDERRTIFGAARSILPANLTSDRRHRERRKNHR
jgi:hypothetical protein